MLTVHHLGKSQSERIVWLCEELGIPYELKRYARDSVTMLAPPDYKALHPIGSGARDHRRRPRARRVRRHRRLHHGQIRRRSPCARP